MSFRSLQDKQPRLSASQLDVLHSVILSCCGVSLVGCLFILRHHYVSARLHSGVSMVQKMVVVLSVLDAGLAFPKMFGNPLTDTTDVTAACNVQAFALHVFGLMDSEARLKSKFKLYVLLAIVPAVACSVALYAARMFGDATFYCWVESRAKQFWAFYLFVVIAILYISVILWVTHNRISRDFRDANLDAQESWALITSKLRIYIAAFIVLWTPSTVFRLFDDQLGSSRFAVALLMQVTVCTQGLATAIIYGGLLTKLYRIVSCKSSISPTHNLVKHYRKPANIFVSTFNMGEARLTPAQLDKWIPLGQTFTSLDCRTTSGPARRASKFHQFNREIGSKNTSLGYHGHIAITVFIKSLDVDNGAFYMPPVVQQEVNVGKSLVLGRASNKGAVGFAFRYYDTSFAFVACHLSSDPKGKSKVRRRNRDSQDILKELHLNLEDVGFEFPHVHHHSFVLGDLNYRLTQRDASADTILELVSKVRQCETAKPAPIKRNRSLRRGLLGKRWSPMGSRGLSSSFGLGSSLGAGSDRDSNDLDVSMLERSVKSTTSVFASSNGSSNSVRYSADFRMDDVLAHDELRTGMRDGQIFYGFQEAKIAFPPTFRRVRGAALNLDAGNWSMEELSECYTTAVEGHGVRVPSYTDRILFFSQPDMRHDCAVLCMHLFQALVNRDFLPIETELANKKLQRMQDVSGVLECQLRLEGGLPSHLVRQLIDLDQRFSSFDRHGHQVMVTIVFPLPSEDIFSAQRKLLELADSMSGGVYLENTDRLLCKTNVAHVKWTDFVRDGITHSTFARPTGNMHVAIKVHAGTQGLCFGQGVICIPQASNDDSDDPPDGIQELNNFVVELAVGGRHTGTMSGSVSLQLMQRASGA
ncbi:Endonuclease/exonuclease/phosphatase [Phytophthora cactorum]|nr:Endonuclease/exonuclease/phosphatase [Phytophthora cactorum]